jgi:cell division protein FtsI/penicillin-binding protein 2
MVPIRLLLFAFICCIFAILIRLFYLQVIDPNTYASQYLTSQKINPERGKILDRNGEPIATNKTEYLLYIEPTKIQQKKQMIEQVDSVLQKGEATVAGLIDESKDWLALERGLSKEKKEEIARMDIPALGFEDESVRYYPESSLSAHLVGFVGKNDLGDDVGYFGIEGYYEKELAGLPGFVKSERDVAGKPIFVGTQERMNAENGRNLVLTIDKAVQNIVKRKLARGMKQYKPKSGCVTVANPKTMEILALSCLPDFDPSQYYKFSEKDFKNPVISDLYEPGSTFKPLVVASALEHERIKPQDFYNEDGKITIGEFDIKNWDDTYEGKISMTRILEKSSNVGMVHIGNKLGEDLVYQTLKQYRFDQKTGVDLEGEVTGYLKPQKEWYPLDFATATFGQGVGMTQLQLLRAFAATINGGNLMKPYIVKEIHDARQDVRVRQPSLDEKLFSERTSLIMRKMLVSTVQNAEIELDGLEGYAIGGKTGTAQISIQGNYDASKTIASFIGFAPADDPQFIILVVLREPGVSSWGSETAAPLFFDIARDLITYYNIPPTAITN